ncbi:Alanine dehydrogenase 1 [Bacillus pseudomycoides]|nr:Alanine dehydrogenase 1 [Bacillus pseudomycoides]
MLDILISKGSVSMKIGVVKEIKKGESRVGMTPENAQKLVAEGHQVLVQKDAGLGSGYTNDEYTNAGASIVTQKEAWDVDMVVKVKEPLSAEYHYFKKDLIVWGFLHLAASKECVEAMRQAGTTAIAGETISEDGVLTLLKPMSAIAGRRAVFMGAYYLEKQHQGEGILLSGIEGIPAGNVVILGGGNASINACDMAIGIGCHVTILELNKTQIAYLKERYVNDSVEVIESNTENLEKHIKEADLFISTILIPGAKPPKIVKEYMVQSMKPGSVIVDIAIDQGGTVETVDHYTTHDNPIFIKHDVIHYAVPNMPGATPRTSTMALANGNIEYLLLIAKEGLENAINNKPALASGINIYKGFITYENLGKTLELDYKPLKEVLL